VPRGRVLYRISDNSDGFYIVVDGKMLLKDIMDRDDTEANGAARILSRCTASTGGEGPRPARARHPRHNPCPRPCHCRLRLHFTSCVHTAYASPGSLTRGGKAADCPVRAPAPPRPPRGRRDRHHGPKRCLWRGGPHRQRAPLAQGRGVRPALHTAPGAAAPSPARPRPLTKLGRRGALTACVRGPRRPRPTPSRCCCASRPTCTPSTCCTSTPRTSRTRWGSLPGLCGGQPVRSGLVGQLWRPLYVSTRWGPTRCCSQVVFLSQLEVFRTVPEDTVRKLAPCFAQIVSQEGRGRAGRLLAQP
jgi:hypothetical protein